MVKAISSKTWNDVQMIMERMLITRWLVILYECDSITVSRFL